MAKEQYVGRRWDKDSRAEHLLRPDVEWPLSVDTWVWPSVFFSKTFKELRDSHSTIAVDSQLEGMSWLDLERMRTHYNAHRPLAPGGVFVGIELLSERTAEGPTVLYSEPSGIQCGIPLNATVPDRLPDGSDLLGYDVATAGWASGLSDFPYTEEEMRVLRPMWIPRLSSVGLLSALEDAVAFRQLSDQRVPGEAPFWIYALWKLPDG